jgi:hypothetical protein
VQGNVPVVVEFPDGNAQPVSGADLHHSVDGQIQELAFAQASPSQELDRESDEWVRVSASCHQQLGGSSVIEKSWQRLIPDGKITGEERYPSGCVLVTPLDDPLKEGPQASQALTNGMAVEWSAARRPMFCKPGFVRLDVASANVGGAGYGGVVGRQNLGRDQAARS